MITIRWATWWPVPYWTDRFNALASRSDIRLDVCFLAEKSTALPLSNNHEEWRFSYRYLSSGEDDAGYYRRVVRIRNPWPLVQGKFDALVMTYSDLACISAAVYCRLLGKPVFFFCANTVHDFRRTNPFLEWLKGRVLRLAKGLLASGPAQRAYIDRYIRARTPIWEIGNPVKPIGAERYLPRRAEIRATLGLRDNEVALLFVGRFSREKGLHDLLNALVLCRTRGVRLRLILVGDGPQGDSLRETAADNSLPVEFHGFLEGESLATRYAAADIFVLPSVSEAWGLVVNEAMEFGLPLVLSSHVGSLPVLLREGRNGRSYPAGDIPKLAEVLTQLSSSPSLRIAMGQESRRVIATQTIERWTDAVVDAVRLSSDRVE